MYIFKNVEQIRDNLKNFHLIYSFRIMSDLIDLYDNECDCNEGELSLNFLNEVYNNLLIIEKLMFK